MDLWYRLGRFIFMLIFRYLFNFKVYGSENVPKTGGMILCMNHQSFVDPPMGGIAVRHRTVFYLARKTLWKNRLFGALLTSWHCIPVDQEKHDMSSLKKIIKLLKEGYAVLLFPEGERCLDGKLQSGKPGVGLIVAKTGLPVVPMRIFGAHEAYPRGGKIKRSPVAIQVGKPIDMSELVASLKGDKQGYQKIADAIMSAIADLELQEPLEK